MKRAFYQHGPTGLLFAMLTAGILLAGRQLSAGQSDSATPTPHLTAFGFAPVVFGEDVGPTATAIAPAPTLTPYVTSTPGPSPTPSATPGASTTPGTTATPSATATATGGAPTATATEPPDDLPTPAANPLQVPETHTLRIDETGRLHIRGEVANLGPDPLQSVRLSVEFLNKKGRVIHREQTMTLLSHLAPNQKGCFTVELDPPKGWRSYTFGEFGYQVDASPPSGLQVDSIVNGIEEFMGWYTINGRVSNTSSSDYNLLRLVGTVYDEAGAVVGCDFAYTFENDLAAGQTDTFELLYADQDYADAAEVLVQAEGERR